MTMLTRDAILSADDLRKEVVKVPEWGKDVEVIVGSMTAAARDSWEQSLIASDGKGVNTANATARLLVACIINEKGERVFKESDAEQLGRKSARALNRLARAAQRLNGLTASDIEAAKGNSDAGPSSGSATT